MEDFTYMHTHLDTNIGIQFTVIVIMVYLFVRKWDILEKIFTKTYMIFAHMYHITLTTIWKDKWNGHLKVTGNMIINTRKSQDVATFHVRSIKHGEHVFVFSFAAKPLISFLFLTHKQFQALL